MLDKQVQEVGSKTFGRVGVVSALNNALRNPDDYDACFNSAFIVAKSFFFLGHFNSSSYAVMEAIGNVHGNIEALYSKQACYTERGVPSLIIVGEKGEIVLRQHLASFVGAYEDFSDELNTFIAKLVCQTIYKGTPFMALVQCMDRLAVDINDELAHRYLKKIAEILER